MNQINKLRRNQEYWELQINKLINFYSFLINSMGVILQIMVNLISLTAALFLVYWSNASHLKTHILQIFQHNRISTAQHQADHLADISYYYALYIIVLSSVVNIARFFMKQYNQVFQHDINLVSHINNLIKNSLQHFLLFLSIYVYLLQMDGFGFNRNAILLLPFWFFLGRVFTFLELLLTNLQSTVRFSMIGWTLTIVPYVIMFSQIMGYSPLKYM